MKPIVTGSCHSCGACVKPQIHCNGINRGLAISVGLQAAKPAVPCSNPKCYLVTNATGLTFLRVTSLRAYVFFKVNFFPRNVLHHNDGLCGLVVRVPGFRSRSIAGRGDEFGSCLFKSRKMRWAGHVARMGEKRNVYRLLEGKRPLARPSRRLVDNIKLDLLEIGWGGVD
jgi:hypothetical protein